jgi:hypothetical protein
MKILVAILFAWPSWLSWLNLDNLQHVGMAAIAVASVLANFIPGHTIVGKLVNWIALNFNKQAIVQGSGAKDNQQ